MRVEVLGGVERRRRWSSDEKTRIVEETLVPGTKISEVARRNGVSASLVFTWRRQARSSWPSTIAPRFAAVRIGGPEPVAELSKPSSDEPLQSFSRVLRKRCELPHPPRGYDRVLKRVGIQYCRISSMTAGMSL